MRKGTLVALVLAVLLAAGSGALHFGIPDFSGTAPVARSLASGILGETRVYFVHLPAAYVAGSGRRYPVVYVLDGTDQSGHTAEAVADLAGAGAFPEAIVVGVANAGPAGRNRDLTPPGLHQDESTAATGQSDRFLRFLRAELIPAVEREFAGSGRRVLAGNSRGGLFVVDAMARDPGLFDAYLANSPALWRENRQPVGNLLAFLRRRPAPTGCLFLSIGTDENERMRGAFTAATQALRAAAQPGFRWHAATTPGAGHDDNAARSTPAALAWIAANCLGR
jgi:predicted alpha/beta superfamily hydrolase